MPAQFQNSQNAGWHRFRLGSFECTIIWDGFLKQPYAGIYPNASPDVIAAQRARNHFDKDYIPMDLNILVVNTGKSLIVVDAGMGESVKMFGDGMGLMVPNLIAAGINPKDVDYVLMTHLHPDHAFGLIDPKGNAVFPNATLCCTKADFDEWTDTEKLKRGDFRTAWVEGTLPAVAPYRDRLHFIEEGSVIEEGVTVSLAPGHSSGQCCFRFESEGKAMVAIGDVAHHELYELLQTDWIYSMDYDSDPSLVSRTREKIFGAIIERGDAIMGFHFPYPGIGALTRLAECSYQYHPFPLKPQL